ncbi:MAG TPA: serine/threonine-protein kinase, partial [Mariprofundaceae bacterium]|nr:serine/threonine-protein kinase [Mariprofundaceae bacterium]
TRSMGAGNALESLDNSVQEPTITSMKCSSCGVDGPVENGLCKNCGAAVNKDESQSALGHYRLVSKLGEGGMGVVYLAHDEKLGREVAIKVLHPHLLQHENLKERFRREARMHAKIIHPNVVTLLSLYEDGEHMALVMEMVHGMNLRQYLRDHQHTTLVDILRISEAILNGLNAAHKLGMVHRDLKPANVLLAEDGSIKLMDFGLAKPSKGEDDLTQSGATVGSFRYMAPEQILNQPVDARTDLYSFGILLYQMCTGKLPFESSGNGAGEFEIMEKQIRQDPVAPISLNSTLPKMLSNLILDLLAKNIADRPANCNAVHQILLQIGTQEANSVAGMEIKIPPPSDAQSNTEIARGLLNAVFMRLRRTLGLKKKKNGAGTRKVAAPAMDKIKHWHAPLTWAALLGVLVGLGWVIASVIHVAEQQSGKQPVTNEQVSDKISNQPPVSVSGKADAKAAEKNPVTESPAVPEKVKQAVSDQKPVASPVVSAKPAVKPKPRPKPKARPSPKVYPVTYRVPHKLVRSDGSRVDEKSAHEFKGKSHLFFPDLKDYRWKETLHTFKKGQLRLYLDDPVRVSTIVIHKASVGRLDFTGGSFDLTVQDEKGKWHDLFERSDRDIDSPVTLKVAKSIGKIKGVRVRFRSAEPLTVGPIDLLP